MNNNECGRNQKWNSYFSQGLYGLGIVTMDSYYDEDWISIEFENKTENVYKKDLIDSKELLKLIK